MVTNYLKTGTQIQKEHHGNKLHQKDFPMIHFKKVVILGDSIVKHVNKWEISQKLKNCRIKVMTFSGATVQDMTDYVKPSLCDKPSHLILHIETNDLNFSKTAKSIVTSTVEQVITINNDHHDVSVSNIVIRKDHLKKKAEEVNSYLRELYMKENIFFIDHSKSIKQRHLNKSQLHFNSKGGTVGETFVNHLPYIFD